MHRASTVLNVYELVGTRADFSIKCQCLHTYIHYASYFLHLGSLIHVLGFLSCFFYIRHNDHAFAFQVL